MTTADVHRRTVVRLPAGQPVRRGSEHTVPLAPAALWTHEETAAYLRLPPATLHQLNYKGTGPRSFKVGRYRRYDPADVAAWLASRASDAG
ncbi:MAG TPA: helix-turn-helix domain-containing protein [Mycobacteriales bacterium]|nr:helix-turn-helix domain-containing protein [Mycobacteriales bacterium]